MLKPGDVILVCGTSAGSKAILAGERLVYLRAKSSHVLIAHNEAMTLDAMPKDGVRDRYIIDVLKTVTSDWRVIRLNNLSQNEHDALMKSCAYYLFQGYKFHLRNTPRTATAYCSELVRSVFERARTASGIPPTGLITPAYFDRIADNENGWMDVTAEVKVGISSLTSEDKKGYLLGAKAMGEGFKLNRLRFRERDARRKHLREWLNKDKISQEMYDKEIATLDYIEANLNYTFWDRGAAK